ncbi:S8 family peptidase [Fusobacterium simiae]|uniref:S8 family peptidase n=1 Tax=Fusobacterium simiae TaxID=855 RepID=A0ABT4DKK1_FUSSI|nr:S8 family peptidase [Fusobacterium simiae]MCY7009125.1 S8 family peptidase [Fusobacterium simiae]
MNDILQLKGRFEQRKNDSKPGASNIPKEKKVTLEHLKKLKEDLINVRKFWKNEKLLINPLISLYYKTVVAKSNRVKAILESSPKKNNDSIVGAKFCNSDIKKHIITHCISNKVLDDAIINLETVINLFYKTFGENITHEQIEDINKKKYEHIFSSTISRTKFVNTIVDSYYLESFGIEKNNTPLEEKAIITLYDTGVKTSEIMKQLEIDFLERRSIDETTILLDPTQYKLLKEKAPYLISMAVSDISVLDKDDIFEKNEDYIISIPKPKNEPVIGVIDTMFDTNVYFSEWVEFKNMLEKDIPLDVNDYYHGTEVSSIIVDGATINPNLDDGCGRFRVRHFGVAKSSSFSSFIVLKAIKEIVEKNKDIKVWNLSLGSAMEINPNFISPEAAILDKIQFENDIIFVIAGTNKPKNSNVKKIGAPADSINSIVVNSVSISNKPVDYSREGLVLSFFNKPDISYYGGDSEQRIRTCSPYGETMVAGTSFAAPWISRKLAYLINILGLSKETAKALIIDSATGWNKQVYPSSLIGYGIVPIKINDIIQSSNDEIKFIIDGISEKYDTFTYNIPVPDDGNKQPFISKVTLCYFPNCSRNQGVDYTNTEMDIKFGRLNEIKGKNGKKDRINIEDINDNKQSEEAGYYLYEEDARKLFRKWDNIKHKRQYIVTEKGGKRQGKKKRENPLWGISIKTKERLNAKDGKSLKFGLVITLKEIDGINRIEEFIQQCLFRGWLVNRINVENKIDIYNKAEEEIIFE